VHNKIVVFWDMISYILIGTVIMNAGVYPPDCSITLQNTYVLMCTAMEPEISQQ